MCEAKHGGQWRCLSYVGRSPPTCPTSFVKYKKTAKNCSNDSIKFGYPNVNNVELRTMFNRVAFVSIEPKVTSILTYNFSL